MTRDDLIWLRSQLPYMLVLVWMVLTVKGYAR